MVRGGPVAVGPMRHVGCYPVRMNMRTNLLLPKDLIDRIDEIAGPRGRSRYVAAAIEKELRRDLWFAAAKASAGGWKDHPAFPTTESVVDWVRALRAEGTDPWEGGGS
jgi:predicted transcriptional regulator